MSLGIIDFHVHSAPSLIPRHHLDTELPNIMKSLGVDRYVMKAHEGSTAERALLVGGGAIGGIVLNSSVGGANPDALETAIGLGARVVWLPTLSARAHRAANESKELSVHRKLSFREVPICNLDGSVCDEWIEIIDLVAQHDLVLASGHITMDEAISVFRVARSRGVQRLLVNHPLLPFLEWRDEHAEAFLDLDAHLEVGILADVLSGSLEGLTATQRVHSFYPASRLVFGSDLGHQTFPDVVDVLETWVQHAEDAIGSHAVQQIITRTGLDLLSA